MSIGFSYEGVNLVPGISEAAETIAGVIAWGPVRQLLQTHAVIASTARDATTAGHSPTDLLRPGLLMGKITATGKYKEWNPTATDGSQFVAGILLAEQKMQSLGGDVDRWVGYLLVGGPVKAAALKRGAPSADAFTNFVGDKYEFLARHQMRGQFRFDDYDAVEFPQHRAIINRTSNYVVSRNDEGCLITNAGAGAAITMTLPSLSGVVGAHYAFSCVANQNIVIAAAGGDAVYGPGTLGGSSYTLTPANGSAIVRAVYHPTLGAIWHIAI